MVRNVGWMERALRLMIAVLILGLYSALQPPWRYLTLVGLVPLARTLLAPISKS